jgi:2-keto-4-pentenoate hydratase/2-oxohepta-3-ene-1,7-dioic acid hydratase in catechol pathway
MRFSDLELGSFRDFYAFEEHVRNARRQRGLEVPPEWYRFPVFYFSNHRALIGHEWQLPAPTHGQWLDYELEIACIIGRQGRDIAAADAEQYIAGYTILNDWSLRDLQKEEVKVGLGPAKGKDFATSLGPYLVTPDELEDRRSAKGYDLAMTARVNGREVSRGNWKDIHYSFAEMIACASQGVALYPGDVLGSGTVGTGCLLEVGTHFADGAPIGSGADGWLGPGDIMELEVERLGVLRNKIVDSSAHLA